MATRASLIANPETKPKVLAESVGWIPLLWVPLMSSLDLARIADCPYVQVDRKEAIERYARATPFLATLFPELDLAAVAVDFAGRLRHLKAKTIAIEFCDHFAMRPQIFFPCLTVAVAAIEAQDTKAKFVSPAIPTTNPFTGKSVKTKAMTFRTTRDILCHALSLDPVSDDDDIMRDQLVGDLLI